MVVSTIQDNPTDLQVSPDIRSVRDLGSTWEFSLCVYTRWWYVLSASWGIHFNSA